MANWESLNIIEHKVFSVDLERTSVATAEDTYPYAHVSIVMRARMKTCRLSKEEAQFPGKD